MTGEPRRWQNVAGADTLRRMGTEPADLAELTRHRGGERPWLVRLILPHIGGGRIDAAQLWAIGEHPDARALHISGLDQTTFEKLVEQHGTQFEAIEFWKCPRIADLTPLEDLPGLRLVSFYWNQRTPRLWNLARNPGLTGLRFDDFTRLHDLADLASGQSLVELEFGDMIWSTSVFQSLDPLAHLTGLRSLAFTAKRIDDGRIEPLAALTGLDTLRFPSNLFQTRQIAWLRAHLPQGVQSHSLAPLRTLDRPLELNGKVRDVLLAGKRKPFLNSEIDARRIAKHVDDFERMVAEFRRDPSLPPD